ncbi:hypothetical protein KL918_000987 [Ogataea parapolymorpha]|uniref:Nuclear fusion protein KAR5 n=1 Tax=Ogataea parapolymorpha (strain ATCC 26012 / BCRC 20466 / JCM 22074 / NRRL Y-7560 / DL-1) TaxID=871575 RepID=W1Q991_OGAPD|nr:Nuclear fusion protein KAR5 [Ogataea parapolymorpha DL-1]ESW97376.1 Nuclear fusion protein KAR5 [Ogataea parapolymorpha DL-1]KAG7869442.1 hypothetical protein KL918_000987 [Ogataea parapolymorpha]KAG7875505.1 hypothetical protein KL916_000176 [Ogataea parapolymorpha]
MSYLIVLLLLAPVLGLSPESIANTLEQLKEAHQLETASLAFPSCVLEVLSTIMPQCHGGQSALTEHEKQDTAIRLTMCIFDRQDGSNGSLTLPAECWNHNNRECIAKLASNPVWWTTFFGYLNLVEQLCHYYSEPYETQRLLETYRDAWKKLDELMATLSRIDDLGTGVLDQLRQNLVATFDSLQQDLQTRFEEMRKKAENQLDTAFASVDLKMDSLLSNVYKVSDNLENMHVEAVKTAENFFTELNKWHDQSLQELAQQMEALNSELRKNTELENERLISSLSAEHEMMAERQKKMDSETATRFREWETRLETMNRYLGSSLARFERLQDVMDRFNVLGQMSRVVYGCGLLGLLVVGYFVRFERLLVILSFVGGAYVGAGTLDWLGW